MITTQLIAALAADAGSPPRRVGRAVIGALLVGAVGAAAVFTHRLNVRPDFADALVTVRFPFKFVVTTALVASTTSLAIRLAKPGLTTNAARLALVASVVMLLAAVGLEMLVVPIDQWAARAEGEMSMVCLINIPQLAAPTLFALLLALQRGAPSSPALSGAVAGLLAGALAATFYAASCPDDSPLFVVIWYTLAIGTVSAVGALAGSRLLKW